MSEEMSLTNLIDFVLRREETSATFFSAMVDRTSDSTLKEIFRTLMKRCVDRMSVLKVVRGQEEESEHREYIPLESIREYLVDVQPRSEITDLQAIALGGLRSETSEKLYERISFLISEPPMRAIFEQLHGDNRLQRQLCNCLYDQRLQQEP